MNIKRFDPDNLKSLRASINEALVFVKEMYGLNSIDIGRISYSASTATLSLKLTSGDKAEDPMASMAARDFGFRPTVYGAEMLIKGRKYTVESFRRTRVAVRGEDGKIYTITGDVVKSKLKEHLLSYV